MSQTNSNPANSKSYQCTETNHANCNWRCNVKQSERIKKIYHEKTKHKRYLCQCGVSVLESYKSQHEKTNKHKNSIENWLQTIPQLPAVNQNLPDINHVNINSENNQT